MIQTGEQYEFVHHALSLYEARLSAETGQWVRSAAGGVDWNLEANIASPSRYDLWDLGVLWDYWRRSLRLTDNMDNQWGLLWAEPAEGKRKGKFLKNGMYPFFFSAVSSSCVVGEWFFRGTRKTRPLHFSADCRIVSFLTNQTVLLPLFCHGDVEIVWLKLLVHCSITLLCFCVL